MRVPRRSAQRLLLAAAALALAAGAVGCDSHDADLTNGQQLFTERCGACHAMVHAGTQGQIGPDLDSSYAQPRADGMTSETVRGVVHKQILHPREQPAGTDPALQMPAELVTGDDAKDVASYVARWAGIDGVEPSPLATAAVGDEPGAQIFSNEGCGSCHTLAAAGAAGATAPSLDTQVPQRDEEFIRNAIVTGPGAMPAFDQLSDEELDDLVQWLIDNAGQ